jgi:hypothetical protein
MILEHVELQIALHQIPRLVIGFTHATHKYFDHLENTFFGVKAFLMQPKEAVDPSQYVDLPLALSTFDIHSFGLIIVNNHTLSL